MFSKGPNKYATTTRLLDFLDSLRMWSKDLNEKVYFVSFIWVERVRLDRDSFERKKLQNIERERKGEIIVIFVYLWESVLQISTADSFTVRSGWFLDSEF